MSFFLFLAIFATLHSTLGLNGPCGGLLEADAGEFKLPPEEILERGKVCVWIVKLVSRQTIQFELKELGEGLTVSLYEEHSPSQSIEPTRLNSSHVGISNDNNGQTLVVVLTQNGSGQGFAFNWGSLASSDSGLLTAANYINQESDNVLWSRFYNRQKSTLSINADQSKSQEVEITADFKECNLVNHCQCSYVAIYEITTDGHLREVSVSCDRPSQVKVQNLFPNVLAFVYLNSSHSNNADDFVEIKWAISSPDVSQTTTSTTAEYSTTSTSTESPTTTGPIIIRNECGGTAQVGTEETVIEYLPPGGYESDEFCVWPLSPTLAYSGFSIDYVSFGTDDTNDGVTIYNWGEEGNVTTTHIWPSNQNTTISVSNPYAAVSFSSSRGSTGRGFQVTIRGTGHLEGDFNNRAYVFGQSGSFSYPEDFGLYNYKPNERVAVVVQTRWTYTQVDIDFTDIEDDSLLVYKLSTYYCNCNAEFIGMTNGSNPEGVPSLATNWYYPRLLLFHSNENSKTGKGFSISWYY